MGLIVKSSVNIWRWYIQFKFPSYLAIGQTSTYFRADDSFKGNFDFTCIYLTCFICLSG